MTLPVRVICLAGPTGSGKTAAALALAQAVGGDVINTDSRQIYKDFPIITAQPSPEEVAQCPHHLYGFQATADKLSAGQWAERAVLVAKEVVSRGKVPLLVGGTGLYFRAVLDGIAAIPPVPAGISQNLLERCAVEGPQVLHAELELVDPKYAARIHPHDRQRVVRALEVYEATRKSFTWWHAHAQPAPLAQGLYCGIDMSLEELTPRLGRRIELMLEAGAVQEAQMALDVCPDAAASGWSGIGCAELHAYLTGKCALDACVELWRKNTRAYAKRQLTLFRGDSRIRWFAPHALDELVHKAQFFVR